jgi:hypothetical protein
MAIVVSRAKRPPDKSDISFGLSGAGSGVDFRWFLSGSSREDQNGSRLSATKIIRMFA